MPSARNAARKGTWMQARRRLAALAMTIAGVLANGAHASDLRIARIGATSQGYPFVDYELEAPFTGKALDAIRSGLPSTRPIRATTTARIPSP